MSSLTDFFTLFAGQPCDPITTMLLYIVSLVASFILMIGILDVLFAFVRFFK